MNPRTWPYRLRRAYRSMDPLVRMGVVIVVLLLLAIWTAGCAAVRSYALQGIDAGAQVNDDALAACQVVMCRAASVGSIRRAFNTEAKRAGYEAFCGDFVAQTCEEVKE